MEDSNPGFRDRVRNWPPMPITTRIIHLVYAACKRVSGPLGELIEEYFPRRRFNMGYGICQSESLRRPHHGWIFNTEARCREQPYEKAEDPQELFKKPTPTKAYPVQILGS